MNEHSLVRQALVRNADLKIEPLRQLCSTAEVSSNFSSFTFSLAGTTHRLDANVLNQVLGFPTEDFVPPSSESQIINFFTSIHYSGELNINTLSKNQLVNEWNVFFDTLANVFSNCTRTNFHKIPSLIQIIGFAVVFNRRINFGHVLWGVLVRRVYNTRG